MKIIKGVMKGLSWILLSLLAFVVCAYLLLLAANMRDSEPSASALKLQRFTDQRMQAATGNNAYAYVMGFAAASDIDPLHFGNDRIKVINQTFNTDGNVREADKTIYSPTPMFPAVFTQLATTCQFQNLTCQQQLIAEQDQLTSLLQQQDWLLARYQKLLTFNEWHENVPVSTQTPMPDYRLITKAQTLLMTHAWLLATQQDAIAVNRLLSADIHFWRKALADADTLLSKLVITGLIKNDLGWANLILQQLTPDNVAAATPQIWALPFNDEERAMLPALAGEWAFFNNTIKHDLRSQQMDSSIANDLSILLLKPLIQKQESANRYADLVLSINDTLQVTYEQLPAAIEHLNNLPPNKIAAGVPFKLYNPVGELMLAGNHVALGSYAAKVADLEGLRRMSVMLAEFRSRGLSASELQQQLSQSTLHNPYTDQPYLWDAVQQSVIFNGLNGSSYRFLYKQSSVL